MAFNDDDVSVGIGADPRRFGVGIRKAEKDLVGFEARAVKMGANLAKIGAVAGVALAGIGVAMVRGSARAAVEIQNLSRLAGAGVEDFQRYAAASDAVGVSQEKLADILKDVNDKFGDFAATGQGPLKDFFDYIAPAVGVTADQFARLSGPEALQLYVSSLEKAGVSQQQMTFYMEALASDATALLPLLRDSGKELQRLGDEADRAGRIMGETAVNDAAALDREMRKIGDTIRDNFNRAIAENSDEILALARDINETWVPALIGVAGFIGDVVGAVADMVRAIGTAIDKIVEFGAKAAEALNFDGKTEGSGGRRRRREGLLSGGGGEVFDGVGIDDTLGLVGSTTGTPLDGVILPPARTVPIRPNSDRAGGGGGGAGVQRGPTREDLERLQENFASQREIIEAEYAEQLEQLRAFRESKVGTEEEFDQLEADIRKKHLDDMAALERAQNAARLQAAQDVLGGMATMMASENKKLFKIGQAAALANAIVSGYEAAAAAWAKGMAAGGPPLAAAYTAASLARTGGLVSAIATASSSGGSGGGGARGGGTVTGTDGGGTSQNVAIQLTGGDIFSRSSVIDLINSINEAVEDGATIRVV